MSSSAAAQNWPIGYPCRLTQNVNPIHGFLQVAKGTEAKIIATNVVAGQQQACIELPSQGGTRGRTGWVPRATIDIGNTRKVGEIGFNLGRPPSLSFRPAQVNRSGSGLTHSTVKELVQSYYNNRKDLPIEPVYIRDKLNNEARRSYFATRICKGIDRVSSKLQPLLNTGKWNWRDIRQCCPNGSNLKDQVGIYLIVHENFPYANHGPEMYTGSTGESFQARYGKHSGGEGWGSFTPSSPHYRIAAKASTHSYFPVCYFDSDDTEKSDLKIAEQIFVDLFQTSCSAVLDFKSFSETNEDTDISAREARREMRGPEAAARAAKYLEDKEAANILASNAENVFAATGWPGGVRRKAGLKPFGIAAGLNWSMPITEMQFEKQTWIMSKVSGQFANFRRVAYISKETSKRLQGRKLIWQKNTVGKGDSNVAFYLPQNEPGPAHGTKVHVVVEVRLDDQPCGTPWSRQATVGPWSDFADATKLAMRIEWEDENGYWFYKHLFCDYPNNYAQTTTQPKANVLGATTGYRVATGLKAYFLRQERPQTSSFPWLYDFGIAEIKEIYFDHLTQAICTRRVTEKTKAPPVRELKEHEIAKQLLDAGAERYAHKADPNAAEAFKGDTGFPLEASSLGLQRWNDSSKGKSRGNCDYCCSMVKAAGGSANQVPCKEVGQSRRCISCTQLKRPCTFTRDSKLLDSNNRTLLHATYNPAKVHTDVKPLQLGRLTHSF